MLVRVNSETQTGVHVCICVHNSWSALECFPDHGSWHGMYWQMWAS